MSGPRNWARAAQRFATEDEAQRKSIEVLNALKAQLGNQDRLGGKSEENEKHHQDTRVDQRERP